ncbi:Type IV secretion system protein PtlC [Aliarcobacter thereius]|nr:Type IV secretion system protein PtlC [Aliarcobacter thereius]
MLFKNEKFESTLVEDLMSAKIEFSIFQSFKKIDKENSINILKDKLKNAKTFFSSSDYAVQQLNELSEEVENSKTNIFDYSFTIQVRNTNLEDLSKDVAELHSIISRYGFQLVTESTNIEPLFFSALPELENYNSRKRNLKTEDIALLNTFSTVSQGFSKCSWGNMPVTQFLNSHNTVFDFTFHKDTSENALAHTLIIGGSNSGKTTLMTFLIQESQKFRNLKSLIFDSLQGMKVFTNFIGGNYINFEGDEGEVNISLNPLQLEDLIKNREFLKSFLKLMLKVDYKNPNDIEAIDNLISNNYLNLKKEDRTFRNVWASLGAAQDSNILEKIMANWVNGSNSKFFAEEDAL